jgi:AraC family transcriptional regulator of arabinose operon
MYLHYIAIDSIHESDFIVDRINGISDFLFLYVKTPSTFIIDNKVFSVTSPSIILINSYTPHKYFPTGTQYIDDYLHFAVKEKLNFLDELTFPLNTPIKISNDSMINELLEHIKNEHNPENKYSDRIIEFYIRILLLKVGEQWDLLQQDNTNIPHYTELLAVRKQLLESPEKVWKVEELSKMANLSLSYFQVMYKKAFGITCITDVINIKLAQAKVLLTSTDLPVNQISQELGYNEVYHFIRQFKKSTGMTPGAFRKKI